MCYKTIHCKIVKKQIYNCYVFSTTDHLTIFSFVKKDKVSVPVKICSFHSLKRSYSNANKKRIEAWEIQMDSDSVRTSLFIIDISILILLIIICAKNRLLHNPKFICLP